MRRLLRKLISRIGALIALMLLSSVLSPAAHAFGMYGAGGFYGGIGGGAMMGPAMSPFMGMPFYPGGNMMMTGQMGFGGSPMMNMYPAYVSNALNWNGAQPMGLSYMPPIGMSAIGNSLMFPGVANHTMMMNQMMMGGGNAWGGGGMWMGGQSFGSSRAF